VNIGHHTEIEDFDGEGAMVIYRPLYKSARVYKSGGHYDVRPLSMFMENVTKDGQTFLRFSKITDPEIIAELKKIRDEMYPQNR
jgi:hypothetical protein